MAAGQAARGGAQRKRVRGAGWRVIHWGEGRGDLGEGNPLWSNTNTRTGLLLSFFSSVPGLVSFPFSQWWFGSFFQSTHRSAILGVLLVSDFSVAFSVSGLGVASQPGFVFVFGERSATRQLPLSPLKFEV